MVVKRVRSPVDPNRGFLLPISGSWILALDWTLFSSNVISAGIAAPIVMGIGFSVGLTTQLANPIANLMTLPIQFCGRRPDA